MEGLAQKAREAIQCLEIGKKVPRLRKILVAPKILEGDLFHVSAVANLSKTRHCFENKG